jgi:alpha-ketoglutarate-dependent taurine dioxygenase
MTDILTRDEPALDVGLEVRHLSGTIGAEIDIDVRDLTDEQVAAIRDVWLRRRVVFFQEQHLTPAEHLAFARRFGEPTEGHPVVPGIAEHPEVFEIDYTTSRDLYATYGDVASYERGISWHTDVTFVPRPPLGSILRAVEVPDHGGDTLFSDQVAAFASLSSSLQDFLRGLTAVHDGTKQFKGILDLVGEGRWEGETFSADSLKPSVHPVVRTHPETGEEILFVNPGFTNRIAELSLPESDALLAFLHAHSVRDQHVVRHHWRTGDIGFWDNRSTQHAVAGDFGDAHRVIQRITLRGDEPR